MIREDVLNPSIDISIQKPTISSLTGCIVSSYLSSISSTHYYPLLLHLYIYASLTISIALRTYKFICIPLSPFLIILSSKSLAPNTITH